MNKMGKIQIQLQKQHSEKPCFGTNEWSKTSGICRGCKLKEDCGKIKESRE
jgi:hypothetical protein